jgi:hypothetical protein
MAASDTTFRIAAVAAQVQTIGQARAVLGETAKVLREAYGRLDEVHNVGGSVGDLLLADWLRSGGLRDEFRSSLDIANAYAQGIYTIFAGATPDLYDEEISVQNARRVGAALERAREILRDIEDEAGREWWNFAELLTVALETVGKALATGVGAVARGAAAVTGAVWQGFWPYILVGGVVLLAYLFRRRILAVFGASP